MDFLQSIIDKYEEVDTNQEIKELFENIKDNNDVLDDINLDDIRNCSFISRIEGLPIPVGTNFFSIYDPLQSVNVIIPDLFKLCAVINPSQFANKLFSSRIMPKNKIKFPDAGGASIFTRLQTLLPTKIIKSFLYFGFKSNFELMEISDIIFVENKIKDLVEKSSSNYSNYSDPEIIFNLIYDKNTLLRSILELNNSLEYVKDEKIDSTNFGNLVLNYLVSTYNIGYIPKLPVVIDEIINYKFNNLIDKTTYSLSYSDLVYLNYLKKLVGNKLNFQNFLLLLENDQLGTDVDPQVIENLSININYVNENNIFKVIDLALEVKSYILKIISYNLNNKTYNQESYTKPELVAVCRHLYCNYAKNENYSFPYLNPPTWCL